MFGKLQSIIMIITVVTAAAASMFAYQKLIDTQEEQIFELKRQHERSLAMFDKIKMSMEAQSIQTSRLMKEINDSEKALTNLRNTLQSHDLKKLSSAKPGLIEKRINDATKAYFDDLARISGS